MHQEHNIPWNSLASNYEFVHDNPRYTPHYTGTFFRQLHTQTRDNAFKHFARVLQKTIRTFSETERKKYPLSFPSPPSGSLFSDKLRDRFPGVLNERNQSIEYWIKSAKSQHTPRFAYDLAEAVKILINENEMEPLLMLARHPQIRLDTLQDLGGHYYCRGFSPIMKSALHAYVSFNLWAAMGLLEAGEYLELRDYEDLVREVTWYRSHAAQQVPHRAFLDVLPKNDKTRLPEVHRDFAGLKEYLRVVFRLLYLYDMMARECGLDPQWEREITCSLPEDMRRFRC